MENQEIENLFKNAEKGDLSALNQIREQYLRYYEMNNGLYEIQTVLRKISLNDFTVTVKGTYSGTLADVAREVNTIQERLLHLQATAKHIAMGNIDDLVEFKKIDKRCDNDELIPAFTRMMVAVSAMIADVNRLSAAAKEGGLSVRADATRHQGEFRTIIEGFNTSLDALTLPLNEGMRVSHELSKGNFSARMDENIQVSGDFAKFRDALNGIGSNVSVAVSEITRVADAYAKYDFTAHIDSSTNLSGDFVELLTSLNKIGTEVSEAISLVSVQVTNLSKEAEETASGLSQMSKGSEAIAQNTTHVHENMEKGRNGINQVSKAMEDLAAAVEEITTNMETVSTLAKKTKDFSTNGVGLSRKANDSMGRINDATAVVNTSITEISTKMNEIGKIVGLIRDLANQTNLLALNAAIEAARAGEAGRGFAVVAAEVKSLAQESRTSAENIETMIGDLQKRSNHAADAVTLATKEVSTGSRDVEDTIKVFDQIVESIEQVSRNTEEVAAATEEQAATTEEITASVSEVTRLFEETEKESSDTAAATQESLASIEEINQAMGDVNKVVANLSTEMTKFHV
ncbi:MAG: methyl-accepting chemotaxis protein [Methanoregula sp.]|nr:methyl-accepting chemotaxis protein [Methanoregula sp.]